MKKPNYLNLKLVATAFACLAASCSIEDTHDLSKDVDMTVAVGNGISIPVGSTEPIMLTEMIDPESSEFIAVDGEGNYTIEENGEIDATTMNVDELVVEIEPVSQNATYSFDQEAISYDDDYLNSLPPAIRDEVMNNPIYTHVVNQHVDNNKVEYTLDVDVNDDAVEFIEKVMFKEPVTMTIDLEIYTTDGNSDFANKIENIHLHTDGIDGDHFYVKMPEYVIFEDNVDLGPGNMLYLEGETTDDAQGHKHITKTFLVDGFDFSRGNSDGGVFVNNGKIHDKQILEVNGKIISDPLVLSINDMINIPEVHVDASLSLETFTVDEVYGKFNPEIDPVHINDIDIDLGDDMDFVYEDAEFRFSNPEIFINIANGASIPVNADVLVSSYDRNGAAIAQDVKIPLVLAPEKDNSFYVTYNGAELAGYESVAVVNLKSLLDGKVPSKVKINVVPRVDNTKVYHMVLGKEITIGGSYAINIPMEFDEFSLKYTEEIEDVLGEDPTEVTDYVTEINSVTLSAKAFNTCPAEFVPQIVAYDAYGHKLNNIVAQVEGAVAAGTGYNDAPAESTFKIKLSALNGELKDLCDIDIILEGSGAGVLNKNSYLQLKDITLTIDQPIIVDMN